MDSGLYDGLTEEISSGLWLVSKARPMEENGTIARLTRDLDSPHWKRRQEACKKLGLLGNMHTAELLIERIEDNNSEVRCAAVEALGVLNDDTAIKHLIPRLFDEDWRVKVAACTSLGQLGDQSSVKPLIQKMGEHNPYIRRAACHALGNLGDVRAVTPLIQLLLDDHNIEVRLAACEALGQLGDKQAMDPLILLLDKSNVYLRLAACKALGQLGYKQAVKSLAQALKDTNSHVRREACMALGDLGDECAVTHLVAMLADDISIVGEAAYGALKVLGEERLAKLLTKTLQMGKVESGDMFFAATGNHRTVKILLTLLDDTKPINRMVACKILGQVGDKQVIEALIRRTSDENKLVCKAARSALGQLGDKRAVEHLLHQFNQVRSRWSWNNEEAQELCKILISLEDLQMVESLTHDLKIGDTYSKESAARLLVTIGAELEAHFEYLLCRLCLTRFILKTYNVNKYNIAKIPVCRSCGKAGTGIFRIENVISVLDTEMKENLTKENDTVLVNWFQGDSLFDFNRVEIISATDYDVEKFIIQVGNDLDFFRKPRYQKIPCTVKPGCDLSDNTLRILKRTFGEVTVEETEK